MRFSSPPAQAWMGSSHVLSFELYPSHLICKADTVLSALRVRGRRLHVSKCNAHMKRIIILHA